MVYYLAPDADAAFARLPQLVKENPDLCHDGWIPRHYMPINPLHPRLYALLQVIPFMVERTKTYRGGNSLSSRIGVYVKHALKDASNEQGNAELFDVSRGEVILCMLALGYEGQRAEYGEHKFLAKANDRCVLPPLRKLPAPQ